ncbi:MAG: glycosyltransferase family 2 protein [Bdellovibrionales bacterium]
MLRNKIPVSVIIVTKNEEKCIARCVEALRDFDEIIVVDSCSEDRTREIADELGVRVETFEWNGVYPKKRQWCLDYLDIQNDWVFFVDADEVVLENVVIEISALFEVKDKQYVGYFVRSRYVWNEKMLRFGLLNSKLVLFDKRYVGFPIINDLNCTGMGEIEGHYQPVLKASMGGMKIGVLQNKMQHFAFYDQEKWVDRHERYAQWEVCMHCCDAWPKEPVYLRQVMKIIFRRLPFRDVVAFMHCYILKLGFLDGRTGFHFALARAQYYRMVANALKTNIDLAKDV